MEQAIVSGMTDEVVRADDAVSSGLDPLLEAIRARRAEN
jgi:hypothetical protein